MEGKKQHKVQRLLWCLYNVPPSQCRTMQGMHCCASPSRAGQTVSTHGRNMAGQYTTGNKKRLPTTATRMKFGSAGGPNLRVCFIVLLRRTVMCRTNVTASKQRLLDRAQFVCCDTAWLQTGPRVDKCWRLCDYSQGCGSALSTDSASTSLQPQHTFCPITLEKRTFPLSSTSSTLSFIPLLFFFCPLSWRLSRKRFIPHPSSSSKTFTCLLFWSTAYQSSLFVSFYFHRSFNSSHITQSSRQESRQPDVLKKEWARLWVTDKVVTRTLRNTKINSVMKIVTTVDTDARYV